MNIRCPYCRHSFDLSRDYMIGVLAEAEAKAEAKAMAKPKAKAKPKKKRKGKPKGLSAGVECVKCRKLVKVPLQQMRRFVPDDLVAEAVEETDGEEAAVTEEEAES